MCLPMCRNVRSKYWHVTHIIFDLDGTLLDTESISNQVIIDILEQYGKVYTEDMMVKMLGTQTPRRAEILVEELDLPVTPEELAEQLENTCNERFKDVNLMPGAETLIYHFGKHHIPMAVATSSGKQGYDIKVTKHSYLFSHMHHVVTGATDPEVENGKPAPDIFLICASRFPDAPKVEKCLVFEDSPNGVNGAIAAGMQVVMIPDETSNLETCQPTLIMKSLVEFTPDDFGLPSFEIEEN